MPPQNSRWDALVDDRQQRDRRGNVGQGYNRWDNRQDCLQDGKEDWSVPLPRNERLEKWVEQASATSEEVRLQDSLC